MLQSDYQIHLTSRAAKDLKKFKSPQKARIISALLKLKAFPNQPQSKTLIHHHTSAQYRLRIGDYRILYDVYDQDKVVLIFRLGHRKDIYR